MRRSLHCYSQEIPLNCQLDGSYRFSTLKFNSTGAVETGFWVKIHTNQAALWVEILFFNS